MGARIRAARERAGISQEELGARVGVKQQSVWKWEAGRVPPSTARLQAIAEALGTSIWELMGAANPTPRGQLPGGVGDPEPQYGPEEPGEFDDIEMSASGQDLEELRQLDPDGYEVVKATLEAALDRARRRREGG